MTAEDSSSRLTIARVGGGYGWKWIKQGWGLFRDSPWQWMLAMVIYLGLNLTLDLIPVVGSLVETLLSPLLLAGLMLGCDAQQRGEPFRFGYLFAAFRRTFRTLLSFAVLVMVLTMVVMLPAMWGMGQGEQAQGYSSLQLLAIFSSFLLFVPLLMATLFPPVLLVFHPQLRVRDALWLSFWGCYRNVWPFLVYGLAALLLMILAAMPMLLGLLIVMPMLIGSVYFAYRDLFHDEQGQPVVTD